MITSFRPEPANMPPETHEGAAMPQQARATCMQEQFSGPLPLRGERRMAEILAGRHVPDAFPSTLKVSTLLITCHRAAALMFDCLPFVIFSPPNSQT